MFLRVLDFLLFTIIIKILCLVNSNHLCFFYLTCNVKIKINQSIIPLIMEISIQVIEG